MSTLRARSDTTVTLTVSQRTASCFSALITYGKRTHCVLDVVQHICYIFTRTLKRQGVTANCSPYDNVLQRSQNVWKTYALRVRRMPAYLLVLPYVFHTQANTHRCDIHLSHNAQLQQEGNIIL